MVPTLRRRSVFDSPLDLVQREFDRAVRNWWENSDAELVGLYPVDIHEDGDHLYVEAELPGFKKEEIQVTLENGLLHLTAERKLGEPKGTAHLQERRFTRVSRSFTLPTTVDESKVEAKLDNGVLRLTLSKREEVKPRKIEVR